MSTPDQATGDATAVAETGPSIDGVEDGVRRAALARLGRMAALTSPALLTLMLSERASAESPPPDPP